MSSGHEIMLGFSWLTTVLSGDSTLMGYTPGGVWRALAPPGSAVPFVIMAHQAGTDVVTMNGFRMLDDLVYQVKVVGPASGTTTLASAAERIDVLLGGYPGFPAAGTVTGGAILACYRESPLELDEIIDGEVWSNIGGLYRMLIEQTS